MQYSLLQAEAAVADPKKPTPRFRLGKRPDRPFSGTSELREEGGGREERRERGRKEGGKGGREGGREGREGGRFNTRQFTNSL